MAKAIEQIEKQVPNQAQEAADSVKQILDSVVQNKESILIFLDMLNEMHEAGFLEAAQSMLKSRHKIGVIGINQLNKSGAQRIIKNGMGAVQFLTKVDPAKLDMMLGAVASGLDQAGQTPDDGRPMGMWGMVKTMRDPEVQSSLGVMMNFLRGMGDGLQHQQQGTTH
jgi:uncharacterized protein YjgD (DUF1641 family)